MRRLSFAILLLLGSVGASTADERPHILYINADDLGVMDVGYRDPRFHTPNIDRLVREGLSFTEAYAPAANCAPSRACVHSGQWGPRHGVYTVGSSERGKPAHRRLVPVKNARHLPPSVVTMAEALQSAGYRTAHFGKYHIGADPTADGFDINVGGDSGGSPSGGYYSPWTKGPMKAWSDSVLAGTHRIDVFVREAVRLIEEPGGKPLFLHFSPYLVHSPLTPVPEHLARYEGGPLNATYASMVSKFDEAVGRLLKALDDRGQADQTLVLFSSDNGGIAAVNAQTPYRAGKGSYYEGGVRVPLVVRWPSVINAGSQSQTPVTTLDLYPTFLEAADADVPDGVVLDGRSLLPQLTGQGDAPARTHFWHFPVYLQAYSAGRDNGRDPLFRTRPGSTVRHGRWKLHEYFEDDRVELYDLTDDPGERTDLSESQPERAAELLRELHDWRSAVEAPVPVRPNAAFDPAAEARARSRYEN